MGHAERQIDRWARLVGPVEHELARDGWQVAESLLQHPGRVDVGLQQRQEVLHLREVQPVVLRQRQDELRQQRREEGERPLLISFPFRADERIA
jgi:hypothetical protein